MTLQDFDWKRKVNIHDIQCKEDSENSRSDMDKCKTNYFINSEDTIGLIIFR